MYDNKILAWGVNELGALGRYTTCDGGLVGIKGGDGDSDEHCDSESDSRLDLREATPTEVDTSEILEEAIFTQLAAGDNISFALTNTGFVYG
jgi:regulator of chromosome condensation